MTHLLLQTFCVAGIQLFDEECEVSLSNSDKKLDSLVYKLLLFSFVSPY
jgi:hypothetical protein